MPQTAPYFNSDRAAEFMLEFSPTLNFDANMLANLEHRASLERFTKDRYKHPFFDWCPLSDKLAKVMYFDPEKGNTADLFGDRLARAMHVHRLPVVSVGITERVGVAVVGLEQLLPVARWFARAIPTGRRSCVRT